MSLSVQIDEAKNALTDVNIIINRMAQRIKAGKVDEPGQCYGYVARQIIDHPNKHMRDFVVLVGNQETGESYHTVIVDTNGKVTADNANGKFFPKTKSYERPGRDYDLVFIIPVAALIKQDHRRFLEKPRGFNELAEQNQE